jgi:type IV pilus assembly protein PilC
LDITLRRLSDFMDKAQKIKGKVVAAMFYPVSVMIVATGIMALMLLYVVPKFRAVFDGLLSGKSMPAFTLFVLQISDAVRHNFPTLVAAGVVMAMLFLAAIRTRAGRLLFDRLKLRLPVVGTVFRKSAISRFTRTLGTLLNSGVPILQALEIVGQTAGNVALQKAIRSVHDSVREGETIAMPLKASGLFPPLVAGMVDVGEQTGALPNMLLRIADNYDDEVDNAVNAMTSLLEPIMIVLLAVVVGSIVIAMFLPIIYIINPPTSPNGAADI